MPRQETVPLQPSSRRLAGAPGWSATEFVCTSGPDDRPFEERHDLVTIAAVLEGSFTYRAGKHRTLLYPGALLLGNAGTCYECGHDHGRGDRCVAVHLDSDFFGEMAAAVAGTGRYQFPVAAMRAPPGLHRWLARIAATTVDPLAREISLTEFAEAVIALAAGMPAQPRATSEQDRLRIVRTLYYIEDHAADRLDLNALAAVAGMSKYHFVRTFRRHVAATPYQYVLWIRLHRAAVALAQTRIAISPIAFDSGFSDLSTFNRHFRAAFGQSPKQYREHERQWRR